MSNQFNRQFARKIVVELNPDTIGAANKVTAKLPQGAILLSVVLLTATAFNSATTTTGTITDGTTVFANGVDLKSTGSETVANAPKHYPQGGTLDFSVAETGAAATDGLAFGIVEYVQVGSGDEIYG